MTDIQFCVFNSGSSNCIRKKPLTQRLVSITRDVSVKNKYLLIIILEENKLNCFDGVHIKFNIY